ncbi:DUF1206 domain-containing protein [Actinospica sp. MGRD01-02]|uniref:DUF1206 domain-containing protein n=1 Tax=Actinospica acidithermotolerans TaxID=2828514 RepID=A0A941E743_9ACTN|nr:DUF1206 domain-containing protein [Actinospica acidithermotolerans]MBR7825022.1 DUF1206 domain-containing protein [Actinospica acidithermotolerans]
MTDFGRARDRARAMVSNADAEDAVGALGRVGLVARGLVYLLIGWITLMIALARRSTEDDRTGALELLAGKPFGFIVLWFLIVGFACMAVWMAVLAARPDQRGERGAGARVAAGFTALFYAVAGYTTARYAVTGHARSTNQVSTDYTAVAMRRAGGQILVAAVGAGLVIGGAVMIKHGIGRRFAKDLDTGSMPAAARRPVVWLGAAGQVSRAVIAVAAGAFLIDAAVTYDPAQARGVDGTLRAFASAPLGPLVLILIAAGLVSFGAYSLCEARWRRQ